MNTTKKDQVIPMIIIASMYVVLGFTIGINAFFVPFVQQAFNVSTAMSYLIMTATFSAYVVFGVPSGMIIKWLGYKGGITTAFTIIAFSFFLVGYSAHIDSFALFLVALFISGIGQTLLTGAINSYVTIIGPYESAARRICIMGISDKLAFSGASLILAVFLDLSDVKLNDVPIPFYGITALLAVMGVLSYFSPLPEISAEGEDENEDTNAPLHDSNSKTSIFQYPHLILGVLAIFFDIGVEIIALGTITDYAAVLKLPSPEHYVWYSSIGMVLGYIIGYNFIPKFVSQSHALVLCCLLGISNTLAIVLVPPAISIYLVAVLGLANSLLWPAIFPLALKDLGRFTKTGSSMLVMGIIGGAIIPLLFGYLADIWSYQNAYLICIPSYLFILYFAIWGSKIRTGKRKVQPTLTVIK